MSTHAQSKPLFDRAIVARAIVDAFAKLGPARMIKNPVMFVVMVGAAFTAVLFVHAIVTGHGEAAPGFILAVSLWLWFTVLFANFAEAMAEGRGKAQADALRKSRRTVLAKRLAAPQRDAPREEVASSKLTKGDHVLLEPGDLVPSDGEVVEGVASVDESAITGESAPVIRESGGDRSAVTGGTRVLSDWLIVRITANPGETFLDRMISMVEGASDRARSGPRILLAALAIVFHSRRSLVSLLGPCGYGVGRANGRRERSWSLLVCLIPTTIGDSCLRSGLPAWTADPASACDLGARWSHGGDVGVLLLDQLQHHTRQSPGHRRSSRAGVAEADLADRPQLASLSTGRRKGRASWCSPRKSSTCAVVTSRLCTRPSCPSARTPA
jgi:K+-transporting ATPase ATPase B chain